MKKLCFRCFDIQNNEFLKISFGDNFIITKYSGLNDNKECKIFDGDIIEFHDLDQSDPKQVQRTTVIFSNGMFTTEYDPQLSLYDFLQNNPRFYNKIVIGNIFQNEYLLEKG